MRTIDVMKKLARNDGRFTHVYTKKELSELFNETGSKLNGTLKSLIKEDILNRAYESPCRDQYPRIAFGPPKSKRSASK